MEAAAALTMLSMFVQKELQKALGPFMAFMNMPTEKRTEFYRDSHDAMGKELKAKIEETISESTAEKEMDAFIADGKYIDKQGIQKKYEEKPDQLKSILENTRTHFCKVRNVLLYGDPEYMSRNSSSTENTKESMRAISCDKNQQASKAAKVVDAPDGEAEISQTDKTILNKEIAALETMAASLAELVATAKEPGLKPMVAPAVVRKCETAIADVESAKMLIDVVLENGKGDVASTIKDCKEANTEAATCAKIMKAQLVVAKSMAVPVKKE